MTNPLQQALVPLAPGGYTRTWCIDCVHNGVLHDATTGKCGIAKCPCKGYLDYALPGANGSLEGEVEVVLTWLAKAGMIYLVSEDKSKSPPRTYVQIYASFDKLKLHHPLAYEGGPVLHEALAQAVKALPRKDAE